MPRSFLALTTYRFTFRNAGIDYYGIGPTPASHDSPTAKGWCRMHLIFDHDAGGWSYYKAAAVAKFAGEGGPGVFCQTLPLKFSVSAARVRPAGAKLKVEFGELQVPSSYSRSHAYLSRVP